MTDDQKNLPIEAVLRSMKTPPPDDEGFRHLLRERLVQETAAQPHRHHELSWFKRHPVIIGSLAGAFTASIILVVGFNLMEQRELSSDSPMGQAPVAQNQPPAEKNEKSTVPPPAVTHRVPSRRVALIKFHFSSEVAVTDVDMKIELPEGLKFWSEGKELVQKQVAWMSNLNEGVNTIPVAVYALAPGRYDVVATALVDGKPVRHTVVLEVSDEA